MEADDQETVGFQRNFFGIGSEEQGAGEMRAPNDVLPPAG